MRLPAIVFVLAAPAVLAACDGKKADAPKGASFGEILPGSASDAMLPYDTARSTPPLASDQGASTGTTAPRGTATDGTAGLAGEGEIVPEVEAT